MQFPHDIELHNEDCLVFLNKIKNNSIDLVLIDPPHKDRQRVCWV